MKPTSLDFSSFIYSKVLTQPTNAYAIASELIKKFRLMDSITAVVRLVVEPHPAVIAYQALDTAVRWIGEADQSPAQTARLINQAVLFELVGDDDSVETLIQTLGTADTAPVLDVACVRGLIAAAANQKALECLKAVAVGEANTTARSLAQEFLASTESADA